MPFLSSTDAWYTGYGSYYYSYYYPYYGSYYYYYYYPYYGYSYYGSSYYCRVCPSCCRPPSLPDLNVSCRAYPSQVEAGRSVTFYASVSGGRGYLRYSWTGDCVGSSRTCRTSFSQPGNYTVTVNVTSSKGQSGTATCSVEVIPQRCRCYGWRYWRNLGCGQNGCLPTQMAQQRTRFCWPRGCDIETETRCVDSYKCVPESSPSGTLSVNSTQVYLGETVILTVEGEDQNGLYSLGAYYNGRWHNQYVGRAVSTSRTWYIRERAPGVYRYCGRVVGYMANGYSWNKETVPTSPDCIEVEVLCPPCEGPGCPENNVSSTSS